MSAKQYLERINALRGLMKSDGMDAVIIPQSDPHQSEYIAEHWQARRWLSGFTGSAGSLAVTADKALLWTDSRYFLQAAAQLEGTGIELMKEGLAGTPTIEEYLCEELGAGSVLGIDGMLFSAGRVGAMRAALEPRGIRIDPGFDPVDRLWKDRPELPRCKVIIHQEKYAGESVRSKIGRILQGLPPKQARSTFISALDEIAWTLNIRSRDVEYNPVATSFLYLSAKGSVLFIDKEKIDAEVMEHLSVNDVSVAPYDSFREFLQALDENEKVLVDPTQTASAIIPLQGGRAVYGSSPIAMLKACKNPVQIEGTRNAMERDGAALVRLFMEIERRLAAGEKTTEIDVARLASEYRGCQALYFDDSFATIAGYNAHGAIVHYSATPETDSELQPQGLLLVDSGAQYLDGTTDITRTVALGTPTAKQRHDFTLVMKGHIALGTAVFPASTRGAQLDALARQFLWKEGLSYLHGTGHGVGHFLNVHEGPQNIRLNENPAQLAPGMITSNEPGIYRAGEYGIRCENLILTVPAFSTEFGDFLKFETLTLFPFDLKLFDTSIMTQEEILWVNRYHRQVRRRLSPLLDESQRQWLEAKTMELKQQD